MKRLPKYGDIWLAEIFGIEFTGLDRRELLQTAELLARLKTAEIENELRKFKDRVAESGVEVDALPKFHILADGDSWQNPLPEDFKKSFEALLKP